MKRILACFGMPHPARKKQDCYMPHAMLAYALSVFREAVRAQQSQIMYIQSSADFADRARVYKHTMPHIVQSHEAMLLVGALNKRLFAKMNTRQRNAVCTVCADEYELLVRVVCHMLEEDTLLAGENKLDKVIAKLNQDMDWLDGKSQHK
jgi:hypothetical protein